MKKVMTFILLICMIVSICSCSLQNGADSDHSTEAGSPDVKPDTDDNPCTHIWADATCQSLKYCSICGISVGSKAACAYQDGVCTVCGAFDEAILFPIYEQLLAEMISMQNDAKSESVIQEHLNKLPYGYRNTDTIREQFAFVKAKFDVFRDGNYRHLMRSIDPTHEDAYVNYSAIQDAYCALLSKQNDNTYSLWNMKKSAEMWLFDENIDSLTLACMLGRWEDAAGNYFEVTEDGGNYIRTSTNLQSDRASEKSYYYYCKGDIIGYENVNDTADTFKAYRIISIGTDTIVIYSFSNGHTYTLKK